MSIKSFLEDGLTAMTPEVPKVRYAVVGLGDIAQEAMLPGIEHTGNSEVTAFVTGDPKKARELGEKYGVENAYSYDQFNELLESGLIDAIYLATPNWLHADFAVPALRAGIHVLIEKPMEVSTARCQDILDAQNESGAKLMIAYRLHFEPATLDAIDKIRKGDLGLIRTFSSTFSQLVNPANHRAKHGELAGPLFDMGPYPVNAARYLFGDEPTEVVSAIGLTHADLGIPDMQDTVCAILKFPGDRIASLIVSYAANGINQFIVTGTKGSLEMNPSFTYGMGLEQFTRIGEKETHKKFSETDQFGGEMSYFSNCILNNLTVEPDGEEGYADVRVLEGIQNAIRTGRSVTLPPFTRTRRINTDEQVETLSAVRAPERVDVTPPSVR
jgi:predicted dehydrogenase